MFAFCAFLYLNLYQQMGIENKKTKYDLHKTCFEKAFIALP